MSDFLKVWMFENVDFPKVGLFMFWALDFRFDDNRNLKSRRKHVGGNF